MQRNALTTALGIGIALGGDVNNISISEALADSPEMAAEIQAIAKRKLKAAKKSRPKLLTRHEQLTKDRFLTERQQMLEQTQLIPEDEHQRMMEEAIRKIKEENRVLEESNGQS